MKRWPRLALPVTIVTFLSYGLFYSGFYRFEQAAFLTQSPWLSNFAYAYETPFKPELIDALRQGLFRTFFYGDSYYDSSLWTMRIEFIGSLIAFGLAALFGARSHVFIRLFLITVMILLIDANAPPWYVAFPAGVFLSSVLPTRANVLPLSISVAGISLALYMAGYSMVDRGVFHPIVVVFGKPKGVYVWIFAAAVLIACTLLNERIRLFFSHRAGVFLGWVSFPLYLVHVPVLCSVGCATLLWTAPRLAHPWPQLAAALMTIVVSLLASIPLAIISDRWVRVLNIAFESMKNRQGSEFHAAKAAQQSDHLADHQRER